MQSERLKCVNPACSAETLYLRSGSLYAVDFLSGAGDAGECQSIHRKFVWLCDACASHFAVETWRPPGEQVRRSRSPSENARPQEPGVPPEAWN
jgi:hypothetical protein